MPLSADVGTTDRTSSDSLGKHGMGTRRRVSVGLLCLLTTETSVSRSLAVQPVQTDRPTHSTSTPTTLAPSLVPTTPPSAAPHCPERPCAERTPWWSPATGTCHRGRDADYIVCLPNSSHAPTVTPAFLAVNGSAAPSASWSCPEHHAFAYSGNGNQRGFCCETDLDHLGVRRKPWDLSAVHTELAFSVPT